MKLYDLTRRQTDEIGMLGELLGYDVKRASPDLMEAIRNRWITKLPLILFGYSDGTPSKWYSDDVIKADRALIEFLSDAEDGDILIVDDDVYGADVRKKAYRRIPVEKHDYAAFSPLFAKLIRAMYKVQTGNKANLSLNNTRIAGER